MTAPLLMIRGEIDPNALNHWAATHGLAQRGGFDEGYALHALLTGMFGSLAPRPFRLVPSAGGGRAVLYGYGASGADDLADGARRCADPLQLRVLSPDSLDDKAMPGTWTEGAVYGFEVRLRPVRRTDKPDDRDRASERDAFQWEADRLPPGAMTRTREQVYAGWLAERLVRQGGASLAGPVVLTHFRRTPVLRKGRTGWSLTEGPDAVLSGCLAVRDGARFHALLAEGIGRHKGFGYGMVLIRPC